jgi:predicted NodU family carbamoyl transferase
MRILSLFYGHDANCTLMEDGEPVVVLEKERLTRVKHDRGAMDIGAILEAYGWNPETIDVVAISPWIKPTIEGRLVQWHLEGETYQENPDFKKSGWRGPVDNR